MRVLLTPGVVRLVRVSTIVRRRLSPVEEIEALCEVCWCAALLGATSLPPCWPESTNDARRTGRVGGVLIRKKGRVRLRAVD